MNQFFSDENMQKFFVYTIDGRCLDLDIEPALACIPHDKGWRASFEEEIKTSNVNAEDATF